MGKLTAVAVGPESFSTKPERLKTYATDLSLAPPGMPNYVVEARTAEEVSAIIKYANERRMPVVPVSSKVHFYGASIPKQGGIILDLTKMNKILEIDELNRRVRIEAGVTWEKLTEALAKKGCQMVMPLLPHAKRSVVTDTLEREVITNMVYDYGEPLQSMEVVWPTGEIFRTGSASVNGYPDSPSKGANPSGPGLDFYRFFQAAQGTMGVVTWANLKMEYLPKMDKLFFAPTHNLDYAADFLYRILRLRIGQECFLLNNVNMASILAEDAEDFEKLRATLPPWSLVLVVSGLQRRPEEKIQFEEDALRKVAKAEFPEIVLSDAMPGVNSRKVLSLLRKPWPKETYWKQLYKGGCQSLFFIARPSHASKFISLVTEAAVRHGYAPENIGQYLQPIEHNRACHLEFNFFYDPSNAAEVARVRALHTDAAKSLLDAGAQFTRPYGELAGLVYARATGYAETLKRVKKVFDPNNIMNPGALCF